MNLFAIFAVVLTLLAVAIVVLPLLRKVDDESPSPVAGLALGVAMPAAVLLVYMSVSNHDWSAAGSASQITQANTGGSNDISSMVAGLEERLRTDPGDVDGWLLLGRTYAQLRQLTESRRAYRQAMLLEPGSEAKLGVAEADIMLDRENLARDAGRLVEEVLAVEPDNPRALFYGGMVAMARDDVDTFRERWQRLLAMSPPDEIRAVIESQLSQVGVEVEPVVAADSGIDVTIVVADGLAGRIKPDAVLFLVAREPDRPGPPLAVIRQDASGLPATLNISDANAMMPGRSLTSVPRLQLIARITNSGEPVAQSGDLFGEMPWAVQENSAGGITIIVDRVVD